MTVCDFLNKRNSWERDENDDFQLQETFKNLINCVETLTSGLCVNTCKASVRESSDNKLNSRHISRKMVTKNSGKN